MNPLFQAALEIQTFCQEREWRFCVIGGLAVERWGEPRLTHDVDGTVLTGFGRESLFIDEILRQFAGRIDRPHDFAMANRVLLLRSSAGVPIDLALGAMPFEARLLDRSTPYSVTPAASLITCSAEDLIVLKAFAGRDRDWADIDGIIQRQGDRLNADLIWIELRPLLELKEEPTDADSKLRRFLER